MLDTGKECQRKENNVGETERMLVKGDRMMEKGEKVWRQKNRCESVGELARIEIMREI